MNFKRPSFKRGGSTGIAQLTPSRQGFAGGGGNIGGGGIGGMNLGTRTGFNVILNEFGMPYQKTPTPYKPNFNLKGGSYKPRNYPLSVINKIPKSLGAMATTAGGIASLAPVAATVGGLAYMNKADTLEGLNYMKSMSDSGVFDETDPTGFEEYTQTLKDIDAEGKTKIGFMDNFFMDEKGKYPGFFGRTDDRIKRAEEKKEIEKLRAAETDLEDGITRYENDEAEAAEQKSALDSALDTMIKDTDKDKPKDEGGDKPEPTYEDIYQTEFDKIQKIIGDDNTKGIVAIALSDAIGTPGTIADKAAVLNKALLGIMIGKKKDKKEIAMLAYKATKQIETAKIAANKQTDSAKNFEELKTLNRIIYDDTGAYSKEQKKDARSRLNIVAQSIKILNPAKESGLDNVGAKLANTVDVLAARLAGLSKDSPGYQKALDKYIRARALALKDPLLQDYILVTDAQVGLEFRKDGGRIGFANGSPIEQITETETVETSGTPTAQVTQLSFQELRDRLPPEVTDDVIRFLSQSEQALQDFAYIRTAGDIKKFNMKYGLNLVLPAQA